MPIELSEAENHLLSVMNSHLADANGFFYGRAKDDEEGTSCLEAALGAYECLLREHNVAASAFSGTMNEVIFLVELSFTQSAYALHYFGRCPRCKSRMEGGYSAGWDPKTNRTANVSCLDCSHDEVYKEFARNKRLTTSLSRHLCLDYAYLTGEFTMDRLRERIQKIIRENEQTIRLAQAEYSRVEVVAKRFGAQHLPGIQAKSDAENYGNYDCSLGSIKILTAETAGRRLVTIEDNDNQATLIAAAEDVTRGYNIQGVMGRADDIIRMIDAVIDVFHVDLLKKSKSVSVW